MRKVAIACLLALSGCSGGAFVYRGETYSFPEEAHAAQERDLAKEVEEGVTPALSEQRLAGTAVVALPNKESLRKGLRGGARDDDEGQLYFELGLVRNELRAFASAFERAKLFDSVTRREVEVPSAIDASADWVVACSPDPARRAVTWAVKARGHPFVTVPSPTKPGKDRFDELVDAIGAAGRRAARSQGSGSEIPPGWIVKELRCEAGDETFRLAFPFDLVVGQRSANAQVRTWQGAVASDDFTFAFLASEARGRTSFDRGTEGSRRDELREMLGLEIVLDRDEPSGEKWVVYRAKNGTAVIARIVRTNRWLAAALVQGLPGDLALGKDNRPILDRLSGQPRAFLASLSAR